MNEITCQELKPISHTTTSVSEHIEEANSLERLLIGIKELKLVATGICPARGLGSRWSARKFNVLKWNGF